MHKYVVNDVFSGLLLMNDGEAESVQTDKVLPVAFFEGMLIVESGQFIRQYIYGYVHSNTYV
jgi:hypothetical protein